MKPARVLSGFGLTAVTAPVFAHGDHGINDDDSDGGPRVWWRAPGSGVRYRGSFSAGNVPYSQEELIKIL